jgi:integrase
MLSTQKYLLDSEVDHLEKTLQHFYLKHPRNTVLIWLMLYTGARPQETLNILWKDFDPGSRTVFIHTMKKGVDREIPIPKWLCEYILALPPGDPTSPIFKIKYDMFQLIWHDYRPVKKTLHSLRHTFAIRLYKKTKDIQLVQSALGHRHLQTTAIYLHIQRSVSEMRRALGY